jgi:hypothetical protein
MSLFLKFVSLLKSRRVIINSIPFIFAALTFMFVRLAINNPQIVETRYSETIYPSISGFISRVSGLVAFSLWDIFWVIFGLLILSGLLAVFLKKLRFRRYILRVMQSVAILYAAFYLLWGYNYFRPDIGTRLGWKSFKPDEAIFMQVLDTLIVKTNSSRITVSDSDYVSVNRLVDESFVKNRSELRIKFPVMRVRPKKMLFSSIASKLGLSGYFGPFTNEVNLNSKLLPFDYPFSLAHEEAHKYGVANEAEANLVSFIICISSDDRRLRYSGYMMLLLYFLKDAEKLGDYRIIIGKIDKKVIEDLRFRQDYYEKQQNKTLEKASSAANDAYLKANNIKTGIKNYNQVVALTISWYRNSALFDLTK